jgi:SAM-dependent methyltransferase
VEVGDDTVVDQGILLCSRPECRSEYPIIDGIPILVADLRQYVAQNLAAILGREDLPASLESLIGDCCGPGTLFDAQRQHLSTYAFDHYADLDPSEPADTLPRPGSIARLLHQRMGDRVPLPAAPVLDLGCSVGRSTFELAARSSGPVLGIDLNFGMLRLAQRVLTEGVCRYPRRRIGLVYDRQEFPLRFPHGERIDFWLCDALHLPFADGGFGTLCSLNLLDCVPDPHRHLAEIGRLLQPGGTALLATPFDWSPGATAPEAWIGGHSQRSENGGAAEPLLRSLLTPGAHPHAIAGLEPIGEGRELPWSLRLHQRSTMHYSVHSLLLRKAG